MRRGSASREKWGLQGLEVTKGLALCPAAFVTPSQALSFPDQLLELGALANIGAELMSGVSPGMDPKKLEALCEP